MDFFFFFVGRGKSYQQLVGNLKVSSFDYICFPYWPEKSNINVFVPLTERGRRSNPEHEDQSKYEGESRQTLCDCG